VGPLYKRYVDKYLNFTATVLVLINFNAFSRQKGSLSIFPYGTEFTIGYLGISAAIRVKP